MIRQFPQWRQAVNTLILTLVIVGLTSHSFAQSYRMVTNKSSITLGTNIFVAATNFSSSGVLLTTGNPVCAMVTGSTAAPTNVTVTFYWQVTVDGNTWFPVVATNSTYKLQATMTTNGTATSTYTNFGVGADALGASAFRIGGWSSTATLSDVTNVVISNLVFGAWAR